MLQVPDRNTKALLDLADFFEDLEPRLYDQRSFKQGAARCICGWCNERAGRFETDQAGARDELGISVEVSAKLFHGAAGLKPKRFVGWEPPGPKDAARTLRHLAVAGEMPADW